VLGDTDAQPRSAPAHSRGMPTRVRYSRTALLPRPAPPASARSRPHSAAGPREPASGPPGRAGIAGRREPCRSDSPLDRDHGRVRPLHHPSLAALSVHQAGQPTTYQQIDIHGPSPGWGTAFYHAINSSTSLLHTAGAEALTPSERVIEIILRLLGPVLLGLAVLAVRGRIKR
jgi:hypothetical protein